jgi:hypothetical protein
VQLGHVPQSSVPPQPLAMMPQLTPSAAQVVGVQLGSTHWFEMHAFPGAQVHSL